MKVQLVLVVNGITKKEELAIINVSQPEYIPANPCNCRLNSECNIETMKCNCEQGYGGIDCKHTQA